MSVSHDTPENPSAQEPYFEAKDGPFTSAAGTHPISTNAESSSAQSRPGADDEAANSAPPDTLGGLVDPQIAALEDGT